MSALCFVILARAEASLLHEDKSESPGPAILIKNLETLASVSPSPMLIWLSQWCQCFQIRVAQHWGGEGTFQGGKQCEV